MARSPPERGISDVVARLDRHAIRTVRNALRPSIDRGDPARLSLTPLPLTGALRPRARLSASPLAVRLRRPRASGGPGADLEIVCR